MPQSWERSGTPLAAGDRCTTASPRCTAPELGRQLADSRAKLLLTAPPFLDVARQAAAQAGNCEVLVLGRAAGDAAMSARPSSPVLLDAASPISEQLGAAFSPGGRRRAPEHRRAG
jgi:hypothetical protein